MAAVMMLSPQTVVAHQLQVAMTTVSVNTRTGSIEVIHRYYSHDTEQVMSVIAGEQVDLMQTEAVQQRFGQYVSEHFHLRDQDNMELPLSLVGVEPEGDTIFVYQETPLPEHLGELSVLNTALLDVINGQVNTVNVSCGEELSTLEFSRTSKVPLKASIDSAHVCKICVGAICNREWRYRINPFAIANRSHK